MIAILMSTYNGERFLKEQIESFFSQTIKNWQLFIRDDGSKDNTVDIIKGYESNYPDKIHVISGPQNNIGAGESFMYLLKVVEADYYMFSDQDDVWMNDKIERTLSKLLNLESKYGKEKSIGVFTDLTVVDTHLNVLMPSLWKADSRHPEYTKNFYKQWTNRHASYGCTQMFNKATKDIVLPYKQFRGVQGAHDNWIEYILIAKGVYDYLDLPTIFYRQHDANVVGINFGHTCCDDIKGVLKTPKSLYYKIEKDIGRIRSMPFHISILKVYWYRFYQSVIVLFSK